MDLRRFTVDVMVRKVSELPDPALKEYSELNARVAYRASDRLEFAVKGFNLLNEMHFEYTDPAGQGIRRQKKHVARLPPAAFPFGVGGAAAIRHAARADQRG